jgi:hypothetical protein
MTTPAQLEANRKNAHHCTGPKTPQGKHRSAKNALRHGLRGELPVIPGEDPAAWETHCVGIVRNLAPAGPLEQALAERVALTLWRLRRAAAYEAAVIAANIAQDQDETRSRAEQAKQHYEQEKPGQEPAVRLAVVERELGEARKTVANNTEEAAFLEQLPGLAEDTPVRAELTDWLFLTDFPDGLDEEREAPDGEDEDFLVAVGVPEEKLGNPYAWTGWTAGLIRRGLALFAQAGRMKPEKLLARVRANLIDERDAAAAKIRPLEVQAKELRRRAREQAVHDRGRRLLPAGDILEKITRYEAHLGRQLQTTLHSLERLQTARTGADVPPPAALDITVNGGEALVPSAFVGGG